MMSAVAFLWCAGARGFGVLARTILRSVYHKQHVTLRVHFSLPLLPLQRLAYSTRKETKTMCLWRFLYSGEAVEGVRKSHTWYTSTVVQRHGCGNGHIERLFFAEHRYFQNVVAQFEYFRLNTFDFSTHDESELFLWAEGRQ